MFTPSLGAQEIEFFCADVLNPKARTSMTRGCLRKTLRRGLIFSFSDSAVSESQQVPKNIIGAFCGELLKSLGNLGELVLHAGRLVCSDGMRVIPITMDDLDITHMLRDKIGGVGSDQF